MFRRLVGRGPAPGVVAQRLAGLVAAIGLPESLSRMGESSPVVLMPAASSDRDASLLRGFRLSVAILPASAPT